KYCSLVCNGVARRTIESRRCMNCEKEYLFKPSQLNAYRNAGKYCSRKCAYEKRVSLTAKLPSNDKYQRTKRKADREWQLAVRERDEYTCKRCGIFQQYIHTHHK